MDFFQIGLVLLSYVAGGIPSGFVISKWLKGIDIREHGSGNPGAANVYRVVGKGAGGATLVLDALKGYFPVVLAGHYYPDQLGLHILCGSAAIVGHVWTIFLRFKGGKAVATSAGVFLALLPKPLLCALGVFGLLVALTHHISAGSMAAALVFPFLAILFGSPWQLSAMAFAACGLILYKHIPNYKRLMEGRELFFKHGSHLENGKKNK